jgi:hypothetical protein
MIEGFDDLTPEDLANALSRLESKQTDFALGMDYWAVEHLSEEIYYFDLRILQRASKRLLGWEL